MNFRSLEYFVCVAEEKSIRKAAKRLYISEQSLGENVHRLEEELGVNLIRMCRPIELTEAGKIFLAQAQDILLRKEDMISKTREAGAQAAKGLITLTVGPGVLPPFLPGLLAAFQKEYPHYQVDIRQKDGRQVDMFSEDEMCFLAGKEDERLLQIPLFEEELVLLVKKSLLEECYPKNWQEVLTKAQSSASLFGLEELPFADWNKDGNTMGFQPIQRKIQELGFQPKFFAASFNQESNYAFCRQGMCAVVGMKNLILRVIKEEELKKEEIYMIPLRLGDFRFFLSLCYLKDKKLNEAEKCFADYCVSYFENSSSNQRASKSCIS